MGRSLDQGDRLGDAWCGVPPLRQPSVTKSLILTGANTGNSALHRYWETCRFWTDIGEVDGRDAAMTSSPPPRFEYACCTA
jgi:hypothetical protein